MPSLKTIHRIILDGMSDYLSDIGVTLDRASNRQKGKAFSEFYMKEIGKYIHHFDNDLIDEGLSGDYSNDLNIDFVYNDDGTFFIYQSKYKGKNTNLTRDEISGFSKIHSRIIDEDYFAKNANDTVKDLLRDFNKKSNMNYVLLTNNKVSDGLREEFDKITAEERERYGHYNIDFKLKDLSKIKDDYKIVSSMDNPIPDEIVIPIEKISDHFSDKKHFAYIDLSNILGEETKYLTYL